MTAPGPPGCRMVEPRSKAPALNQARPRPRASARAPWEMPWLPGKGDDYPFVFILKNSEQGVLAVARGDVYSFAISAAAIINTRSMDSALECGPSLGSVA